MKRKSETYIKAFDKEKAYFRGKENEFRKDSFSRIRQQRHKFVKTNENKNSSSGKSISLR